jgi:hypothetical protein
MTEPDVYAPGESVHVTATFTKDGSAADPATIVLVFQRPDGTTTTWQFGVDAGLDAGVMRSSQGVYYANIPVEDEGQWVYRFTGTGEAAGSSEGWFTVSSRIAELLDILIRPADYDSIRAMLGVERIDVDDDVIELPSYAPYIEARVKVLVTDWATIKEDAALSPFLRAAVRYGVAAELAESYVKGGTVSLVHREEPRRNWSEWARIFWQRYEEALSRITTTGVPDDSYDMPTTKKAGPSRSASAINPHTLLDDDWAGTYPPVWPE